MTLTKFKIAEALVDKLGFPLSRAKAITETLLEIMKDSLESGDDVMISGFGKFSVREKAERKGRNPATNGEMMLRSRRVVTFKGSGKLRKMINGQGQRRGSGRG